MKLSEMTPDERSLLIYFETRMVDGLGYVESVRMNAGDFAIAKRWNETKFIQFGRVNSKYLISQVSQYKRDHWVRLSAEAWRLAHEERMERASRIIAAGVQPGTCNGLEGGSRSQRHHQGGEE